MITDALLHALTLAILGFTSLLPQSSGWALPDLEPVWGPIRKMNSLLPIGDQLVAVIAVLAVVGVFVLVRLLLVLWNAIWP